MNGRDRLRKALRARMDDPRVVLLGEAVGCHGLTEGFPAGPSLLRTPLSENAAVGVATGLALAGRRPVLELVDPRGLERAADALADLATVRARSRGAWTAPVVIRAPWIEDARVPDGIVVAAAATGDDLVGMLAHALAGDEPVVILEGACAHADTAESAEAPALGRAVLRRAGRGCTILASGEALPLALAAAELHDAEVLDLRGARPLDVRTIGAQVRGTGRAVVVGADEPLLLALREAFLHLESPLRAVPFAAGADAVARAVAESLSY